MNLQSLCFGFFSFMIAILSDGFRKNEITGLARHLLPCIITRFTALFC